MSKSKLALGKGMSALLSNSSTASNLTMKDTLKESPKLNEGPTMVPIEKIKASKDQPRKIFKDKGFSEIETHKDLAGHERVTAGQK